MSRFPRSMPPAYFEALYAQDPDPWRFADSAYERDKYAATLAALPRASYASALEIGCSIGVLTRELAARCDALVAVDVAETALEAARRRCATLPNVRFARHQVPASWPPGRFDLVLLSEVVYYLDEDDIIALAGRVADCIAPGGDVLLVHWLGETNYPSTGDEAAERFLQAASGWAVRGAGQRGDMYRIDKLRDGR